MRKQFIFILVSFIVFSSKSQEIHFSMFYNSPLQVNPAYAGMHECYARIGTCYKDQWRSVSNPYKTYNAFADIKIKTGKREKHFFGAGVQFLGDISGTGNLITNDLKMCVAYHQSLMSKNRLIFSMGLSFSLVNRRISEEKLTFESQWNGTGFNQGMPNQEIFSKTSIYYFDLSAGAILSYSPNKKLNASLGTSLFHLTQPRYSFFGGSNILGIKTCLHGSLNAMISKKTMISPKLYWSFQDRTNETVAGMNFKFFTGNTPFFLGMWYRWARDVIPVTGLEIGGFQLMLAYDFNISRYKIATNSYGGFEISLIKNFLCGRNAFHKEKKHKSNFQDCPLF